MKERKLTKIDQDTSTGTSIGASRTHTGRMVTASFLLFSLLAVMSISCNGQSKNERKEIRGYTMGTTYRVLYYLPSSKQISRKTLAKKIYQELNRLDSIFSTWKPDSEISRFNRYRNLTPFPISTDFATLMKSSFKAAQITGGAFDPAMHDLIALWGFAEKENKTIPDQKEISKILMRGNYRSITLLSNSKKYALRKARPDIKLNLSGSAKGFASEKIGLLLKEQGIDSFMVEVGGEITVGTARPPRHKKWRVGIEKPNYRGNRPESLFVVFIKEKSMATSGDYRNFYIKNGKRYAHIIDPRTGKPAQSQTISATVIGPSGAMVDALATALLTMSANKALRVIENIPEYDALLLIGKERDVLLRKMTSGMKQYLQE